MALSRKYSPCLSFSATAIIFLSLTLILPQSAAIIRKMSRNDDVGELRKMILGSRPPECVNKCMSCRPCEANLVIPPHKNKILQRAEKNNYEKLSSQRADGNYYVLVWNCRCGNKLYQP